MWVLTTSRGQQLAIARLPAVLGNGAGADVRVPHASIVAEHARISEGSAGTLRIEALADGIVAVGGRQVQRSLLRDGDELVLGRVKFTLHDLTAVGQPGAPGRPVEPRMPDMPGASALAAPTATAAAATDAVPELVQRKRTLQFSKVEARRGLLNADFSQLPTGQRIAMTLGVLLLAGALMAGVALLVGLFG